MITTDELVTMHEAPFYDATSEQVQSWNYHTNLSDGQTHQLLMFDITLKELDVDCLEKAIAWMIKRHESLRTYFGIVDGNLRQFIAPYSEEIFSPEYYEMDSEYGSDAGKDDIIATCRYRMRVLHAPPLIRTCICKMPDAGYYFCLLVHHIISDEWSMSIIKRELNAFYESAKQKKDADIAPLALQLKDYASWQKRWLNDNRKLILDYWRDKLQDIRPGPVFGRDYKEARHILNTGKAAAYTYDIGEGQYAALLKLSQYCKANIVTIINVSLQLLFHVFSGKDRILIAMPLINRYLPGSENIIGCLGGGIYLRQVVREELALHEYVKEAYLDFLEASSYLIYDHHEMQLNGEALRMNCDVFVNFLGNKVTNGVRPHLKEEDAHRLIEENVYYALACSISEYPDSLICNWKYNLSVHFPGTVMSMAEKHRMILHAMCQNPLMPVRELLNDLQGIPPFFKSINYE